MSLTWSEARTLIDAAFASARHRKFRPMAVVVVDGAGQVVGSGREAGATALRLDIAHGKAAAAVGMGVNSRVLAERSSLLPVFLGTVAAVAQQPFVPQTGAVLMLDGAGTVIGAAGASGGTGDEDEEIVIAGMRKANIAYRLPESG